MHGLEIVVRIHARSLALLIRSSQPIRLPTNAMHLHQVLNLLLIPVKIILKLLLVLLHHGQLTFDLLGIAIRLEGPGVQVA